MHGLRSYSKKIKIVSEKVQPSQPDNQGRVVALDPGVRTFMTFLSEDSFGWLGNDSKLNFIVGVAHLPDSYLIKQVISAANALPS